MKPPKGTKPSEDTPFLEEGGTVKSGAAAKSALATKESLFLEDGGALKAGTATGPSSADTTTTIIQNPLLTPALTEKVPALRTIDLRPIHRQLEILASIIYESTDPVVKIELDRSGNPSQVRFQTRNNGRVSRGSGTHAAAIPQLAFALGNQYYKGKRSLDSGGELRIGPYEFVANIGTSKDPTKPDGHELLLFITDIRDMLLEYEISRFFISAQNARYFTTNKAKHPVSGKGATNASNCCVSIEDLLDDKDFELEVETNPRDPSKNIIHITYDEDISGPLIAEFCERFELSAEKIEDRDKIGSMIIRTDTSKFLSQIFEQKTSYQGLIIYDDDGKVLAALRKNPGQKHILGYGTSGGHCSDPYHPRIAAIADAGGEFGLIPAPDFDFSQVVWLPVTDRDVKVYTVSNAKLLKATAVATEGEESYAATISGSEVAASGAGASTSRAMSDSTSPSPSVKPFKASEKEFLHGTEEALSFKEMRERNLPLRDIPSLELYLEWQEGLLRKSCHKKDLPGLKEIVVGRGYNSIGYETTRFSKKFFGQTRFLVENPDDFKTYLEDFISGEIRVIKGSESTIGYVIISDLNPQQVLDSLEGRKSKADLDEYLERQTRKKLESSAAIKIQDLIKFHRVNTSPFLPREISAAASSSHDDGEIDMRITELSARNLAALRSRLADGGFLPSKDREALLEKKEAGKLFTEQERTLLRSVIRCFDASKISICTGNRGGIAVESAQEALSTKELVRRSMIGAEAENPDYKKSRMGENVFSTVGSSSAISPYFSRSGFGVMYRFEMQSVFADEKTASSAWIGPNVVRLLYGDPISTVVEVGDGQLRVVHNTTRTTEKPKTKTYTFLNRKEKEPRICYDVALEDEIVHGKHIPRFLAYTFIERLRYLGGDARKYLLSNPDDEKAVEIAVDELLAPDYNYALHFPGKLPLPDRINVYKFGNCVNTAKSLSESFMRGDTESLRMMEGFHSLEMLLYSFRTYSKASGQDCFVKAVEKAASDITKVAASGAGSESPEYHQRPVAGKLDGSPILGWLIRSKFANEFAAKQRMSKTLLPETTELLDILNKTGSEESLAKLVRAKIIDVDKIIDQFANPKTRTSSVIFLGSWVMRSLGIELPSSTSRPITEADSGAAGGGGGADHVSDAAGEGEPKKPSKKPTFTVGGPTDERHQYKAKPTKE